KSAGSPTGKIQLSLALINHRRLTGKIDTLGHAGRVSAALVVVRARAPSVVRALVGRRGRARKNGGDHRGRVGRAGHKRPTGKVPRLKAGVLDCQRGGDQRVVIFDRDGRTATGRVHRVTSPGDNRDRQLPVAFNSRVHRGRDAYIHAALPGREGDCRTQA